MNNAQGQRFLAVGLLIAVIVLFAMAVLLPLISAGLGYNESKSDLLFRMQRQQKILGRASLVQGNLEQMQQEYASANHFSSHGTEALASAELQNIVKSAITEAGGQLTSTQGLPLNNLDKQFFRIAVKVRMTGNLDTLRQVLYAIESADPVLIVDQLDINPVRGVRNRTTNKIDPSNQLNVGFQVVSFMRGKD